MAQAGGGIAAFLAVAVQIVVTLAVADALHAISVRVARPKTSAARSAIAIDGAADTRRRTEIAGLQTVVIARALDASV